jgi:hypothetical protein
MADTCLLSYAFSTAPIPLQVNPPNGKATSRINLAVFNPTPGVLCSQITVAVPVGTTPTDFCIEPPAASVNTGKWTISSQELVSGEQFGLGPGSYASITFQCRDESDYGLGYSLVLSLVGVANSAVGEFVYAVQELSGTSVNDLTPKVGTHTIGKTDAIFTLANFVATAPDKPTVPATSFTNGQPIHLSWESNGTWFQLYTKGSPTPVYAGEATSYDLPAGLAADAQFVLVASVTGNPGQDSPSPGYQPIFLYEALTLVVSNPDLTPKSVAASGAVSAGTFTTTGQANVGALTATSAAVTGKTTAVGGLDVGTSAAPTQAEVYGKLAVTQAVSTGGLTVTGPATVSTTLQVTGKTTMGEASATTLGASTVNAGSVTAQAVTVNGGGNTLAVVGGNGQLWIDTNNRNAAQVFNTSQTAPTAWFQNRSGRSGNYVTGVVGWVAQGSDTGLYTNGRIGYGSGMAALTHLPTRHGHRVVTSPLVVEAELHISGSGRLENGRAQVTFDEEIADLVHFTGHAPYRVLLTPTAQCAGLVVVAKAAGHFVIEEAGHGQSDASFDWMVITRQRAAGEASVAMQLPAELPQPQIPVTPTEP